MFIGQIKKSISIQVHFNPVQWDVLSTHYKRHYSKKENMHKEQSNFRSTREMTFIAIQNIWIRISGGKYWKLKFWWIWSDASTLPFLKISASQVLRMFIFSNSFTPLASGSCWPGKVWLPDGTDLIQPKCSY